MTTQGYDIISGLTEDELMENVSIETLKARAYAKIMKSYGLSGRAHSSKCMLTEMTPQHRSLLNLHAHLPQTVELSQKIVLDTTEAFIAYAHETAKWPIDKDFECVVRFDWSLNRNRSRGGTYSGRYRSYESPTGRKSGAMISMAMGRHVPVLVEGDAGPASKRFTEYAHIKNDPEIGTFEGTWEDCLRVLTIHEVAHAFQFNARWSQPKWKKAYPTGTRGAHKQLWQDIYREGRRHFGFVRKEEV